MEDQEGVEQQGGLNSFSPQDAADYIQGLLDQSSAGTFSEEAKKAALSEFQQARVGREQSFNEMMNQITAAKQRLLAQPTALSREDYVRKLGVALTAPKERTDPRFYERQNLATFLRDINQFNVQQSEAEKAAKIRQAEEAGKWDQLAAKYGLESAEKRYTAAAGLLGKIKDAAGKAPQLQSGAGRQYVLPDGTRKEQVFDPTPGRGPGIINEKGEWERPPEGARLVTSSALNPLSANQFDARQLEFQTDVQGLSKLQKFFSNVQNARTGFSGIADQFIAGLKTLTGGKLTPEQFSRLDAQSQQQVLLGALRTTALGPGALSNYDAERLVRGLGGDVSGLFNKDVMAARMQELFDEKLQRAQINSAILKRTAPYLGYDANAFEIPEEFKSLYGARREVSKPPPAAPGAKPPPAAGKPPAAPVQLPQTKVVQGQTWTLHEDKQGRKAYVSPDGKQFEEVP